MRKRILVTLFAASLCLSACSQGTKELKTEDIKITSGDEALTRLKDGNKRFVEDKSELINVSKKRRKQLEKGQSPYAVVLSCSDSRVTPTALFNVGLGEIFDVRVAGNVVDDDALGSIEYGVEHCQSPLLVIMGHESCGAVTAAYETLEDGTEPEGKIASLINKITPSIKGSKNLEEAIERNTHDVYNEVMKDEVVKEFVEQKKLKVVVAHYDLDGHVSFEE